LTSVSHHESRTCAEGCLAVGGIAVFGWHLPLTMSLWKMNKSDYGDQMMLSRYFALGIILLMAVRNPLSNRSLIAPSPHGRASPTPRLWPCWQSILPANAEVC
jgi:hypothetical protein